MDTAPKIPPRDRTDDFFTYTQAAASNSSTAPDVLRKLATSRDRITRAHVTANPNTPTDVLWTLGAEFPEQLINNPIFNLLFLENSQVINQIPGQTLIKLLMCEQTPLSFLELATDYCNSSNLTHSFQWSCISALTINSNTSKKILNKFNNNLAPKSKMSENKIVIGEKIADVARSHINWSGEINENLEELFQTVVVPNIWFNLGCPYEVFRHQYTRMLNEPLSDFNELIELGLIKLGLVPESILSHISSGWQNEQRVKMSPQLKETIDIQKMPCSIRQQLESYSIISEDCLEKLIQPGDRESCYLIARIEGIPVTWLEKLAKNDDNQVRMAVARNPTTPDRILKQLQQDSQECIALPRQVRTIKLGEKGMGNRE